MGAPKTHAMLHRVTDTMSYRVFALLFLAAVISASTGADDLVAETVESEIAEVADVNLVQLNSDAKTEVDSMLKSGKSITECRSVADGCIKGVTTQITALQTSVNNLPSGKSCSHMMDTIIIKAKQTLNEANVKYNVAYQAYISAHSTRLEFKSITIGSIKMGDCSAFFSDKGFIAIKHKYEEASRVYVEAKGALKVARKGWEMAIIEQKKAIRDCACNTINRLDTTWSASLTAYARSTSQWKKCHLMECAIAGTSMSSCNIPSKPKLTKPGLRISFNGEVLTSSICHGHHAHKKWPALKKTKTKKPKSTKGKLSVYVQTGNVPGAETARAPVLTFRGDTGRTYKRKLTPPGKGKAGTYHLVTPKDLGNILSVTLLAGSQDGWLITGLSVKSGNRKWKSFGCIPQWLDAEPYDRSGDYLCPGEQKCIKRSNNPEWDKIGWCDIPTRGKGGYEKCMQKGLYDNGRTFKENCAETCCLLFGNTKFKELEPVSPDGKYYQKDCSCEKNGQCWGLKFKINGDCSKKNQCTFSYPQTNGKACYGYLMKKTNDPQHYPAVVCNKYSGGSVFKGGGGGTVGGSICTYRYMEHYIRSTGCVTGGFIEVTAVVGQRNMQWKWYKGGTSKKYQLESYQCKVPRTTGVFTQRGDHCPHHDEITLTAGARQC